MSIFSKIFGDANQRIINKLKSSVDVINQLESQFQKFSLEELKNKRAEFKERLEKGETLDDILPEAFAAVREAARRTLGQRHFDVQLMGGIVLHQGKIAEMKTGEGKTLVATLPTYLNAISGEGVHVVTVNDYLARRDATWMGQIHYALGLSVACINHEASYVYDPSHHGLVTSGTSSLNARSHIEPAKEEELDEKRDETGSFHVVHEFLRPVSRREAYLVDVTYGTNNEFGFDYLRDNMAYSEQQMSQAKGHHYAIVDEIDSILIDEARTPLIISAPDTDSTTQYQAFSKIVTHLKETDDYTVDEKLKSISITEQGIEKVEKLLNVKNIYEEGGINYVHHLEEALKARVLFHLDKDYVVRNGEIIIVDEFTGRLMPGRRWSGGLHQAVEAKEGVYVQKESKTLATITFQNYFRLYNKLSGMTGTAQTSAEEFHKVYQLDVVTMPTNRGNQRKDLPDRIYKTENGKIKAIVQEVKERHASGQPVLIGTVSIQKNEILAAYLEREGIPHKILNAKNHEQEGEIIAQAGKSGRVTVATNLAGRGVDIILGGNPADPEEAKKVKAVGGLHIIGTERHEARRIDDQLRGRAGRQGDPGSSQFFVSTDDEVVRIFGGDRLRNLMDRLGVGEEDVIENRFVSRAIEQAQSKIEGHNFDMRKYVLEYDDVMNKHRETIYKLRREALFSSDISGTIQEYIYTQTDAIIQSFTIDQWNLQDMADNILAITPLTSDFKQQLEDKAGSHDVLQLKEFVYDEIDRAYAEREQELGVENMRTLEKTLLLKVIDELWVDHLDQMEYLRDSVRLRAYGQRDPLIEYKIEGQRLFTELQAEIAAQIANSIFKVSLVQNSRVANMMSNASETRGSVLPLGAVEQEASRVVTKNTEAASQTHINTEVENIGRNDPCPCGSGKKYKKCGLLDTSEHQRLMNAR